MNTTLILTPDVSQATSNTPVIESLIVPSVHSRHTEVTEIKSPEQIKMVNKTIKVWKEAVGDRFGEAQKWKNEDENKHKYDHDEQKVREYKDILTFISTRVDTLKKDPSKCPDQHILVAKTNETVQGIAVFQTEPSDIYLKLLASAPWNITLNAPVPDDHRDLQTKKIGTHLIAKCYERGLQESKQRLILTPMSNSLGFYRHIGMKPIDEKGMEYYFDIANTWPKALQEAINL